MNMKKEEKSKLMSEFEDTIREDERRAFASKLLILSNEEREIYLRTYL